MGYTTVGSGLGLALGATQPLVHGFATRGPPGSIMQPAATFKNDKNYKVTWTLGVALIFLRAVAPAHLPTIIGVARYHKKLERLFFGGC